MDIIIPIFQFGRAGGYRVISKLATEWQNMGHNVTIAVHESSDRPYFPTEANIVWYSGMGEAMTSYNSESRFRLFEAILGMYRLLSRSEYRKFTMIATLNMTAFPVYFAMGGKKRRYYYIQAYEPEYYGLLSIKGIIYKFIASLSYFLPLKQIANSHTYIGYKFVRAKKYCPPGIDLDIFYPKDENMIGNKPLTVAFLGRSEPSKGTAYILKALDMIDHGKFTLRSAFADGISESYRSSLSIEIVDIKNDSELAAFYREADILITAVVDQLGAPHMPCYEALASGTILISTGHLPADEKCAWIVPPRDSTAIANALIEIDANRLYAEEKQKVGLEKIRMYQWRPIAKRFLSLL